MDGLGDEGVAQRLLRTDASARVDLQALADKIDEVLALGLESCLEVGHLGSEDPAEPSFFLLLLALSVLADLLTDLLEEDHLLSKVLADVLALLYHPGRPGTPESLYPRQHSDHVIAFKENLPGVKLCDYAA